MATPVNEKFRHRPLLPDQIRLVRIEQNRESRFSPCDVEVKIVKLSNKPTYTCVSYMWGPSELETNMNRILLDGQEFAVRQNLWNFLKQVSLTRFARLHLSRNPQRPWRSIHFNEEWLWIDALCIDQNNIEEKSAQVRMMGRIFELCQTMLTWTGVTAAFDYDFAAWSPGDVAAAPQEFANHVLTNAYWNRTWIVQEQRLSSHVEYLTGSYIMHTNELSKAAAFLSHPASEMILSRRTPGQSLQKYDLHRVLKQHSHAACSDPRDRIYALLSCIRNSERIQVDYDAGAQSLFHSCMVAYAGDTTCFCLATHLVDALELKPLKSQDPEAEVEDVLSLFIHRSESDNFKLSNSLVVNCQSCSLDDLPAVWRSQKGFVFCLARLCGTRDRQHLFLPVVLGSDGCKIGDKIQLAYGTENVLVFDTTQTNEPQIVQRADSTDGSWCISLVMSLSVLARILEARKHSSTPDCEDGRRWKCTYGNQKEVEGQAWNTSSHLDVRHQGHERTWIMPDSHRRLDLLSRRARARQRMFFSWLRKNGFEVDNFSEIEDQFLEQHWLAGNVEYT